MRIKKRPFHFFLLSILFAIGIGYLLFSYPPTFSIPFNHLLIPIIPLFFLGIFLFFFCLLTYLTYSKIQGVLFGIVAVALLLLRFFGLTHIFFTLMLLALFVTFELFFLKKK